MDCSLPSSSVYEVLQARILDWVDIPPPGDLPDPGIQAESLASPTLAGIFFKPLGAPGEPGPIINPIDLNGNTKGIHSSDHDELKVS